MHAAYARTLSEHPDLAGGDRAGVSALLAHHWYAAHDLGPALAASIAAALEAERVAAVPEARGHYERALSLWSTAPGIVPTCRSTISRCCTGSPTPRT